MKSTALSVFNSLPVGIQGSMVAVYNNIKTVISSVQEVFDGVIEFVSGVFTGNWGKAWNGVKDVFTGVFSGLGAILKLPINEVIGLINTAIDGIDSLHINIPAGVPVIGGQSIGFSIPHIPQLAQGGVIQHQPGGILANIGEGNYDEAVVPLKNKGGLLANIGSVLPNITNMVNTSNISNVSNMTNGGDQGKSGGIMAGIGSMLSNITQMVNNQGIPNTSNISSISNTFNNSTQGQPRGIAAFLGDKGKSSAGISGRNGDTYQITYSPTFPISGSTAPEVQQSVKQAAAMSQSEFARFMKEYDANQRRVSFA